MLFMSGYAQSMVSSVAFDSISEPRSLWDYMSNFESMQERTFAKIRPWGESRTPLMPVALRDVLGANLAPETVCALAGKQLMVRDLGADVWDHVETVDQASLQSLVALVRSQIHRVQRVRFSLAVGGQPVELDELPLSTRTRNALGRNFRVGQLPSSSFVRDLLMIPNFGVRSLVEFSCVLEAAQSSGREREATDTSAQQRANTLPSDVNSFFQLIGAWAAGEQQLEELELALPPAHSDWPDELRELWSRVGRSNARMLAGDRFFRYSVPALVSRWTNGLDERRTDILKARVFAVDNSDTLEQVGERHGVTRERIRQVEKQAIRYLEQLQSTEYRPVLRRARMLRDKLGTVLPSNCKGLVGALDWAVADFGAMDEQSLAQKLFLWLAGPYKCRQDWLIADSSIVDKSKTALLDGEIGAALIPVDHVRTVLNELGIAEVHHDAWIDYLNEFKRVEDGLLHFTGSILDKAERLLRYTDRPVTADELVEFARSSSVRSVRQRLMGDPRFWRINKQNEFVLAGTVGYDEYTGITDEIIQELEACGGGASVEHLVQKITATYGVQSSSVLAYLNTPLFVRDEADVIRVRQDEEVVIATDISKTAGCYRVNDKWAWRAKVDHQLLRGSGRLFPNAFAREVGCDLGDKIVVGSAFGNVTISWLAGSTTGASIGSIRSALLGLGAAEGDYVFVIAHDDQIEFQWLRREQVENGSAAEKLALLVGVVDAEDSEFLNSQIAAALAVDRQRGGPLEQQIRDVLLSRGEDELGSLIQPPKLSIDEYLDRIGSVLGDGN